MYRGGNKLKGIIKMNYLIKIIRVNYVIKTIKVHDGYMNYFIYIFNKIIITR